jgi:hypothetical protein
LVYESKQCVCVYLVLVFGKWIKIYKSVTYNTTL